jgi:tetratricopeptide (TPR) repeat protein
MEERKVLDSWKEISAYLKRSEKTCQRWEVELGLPIHRLDGIPKARVFAYSDELDSWLAEKPFLAGGPDEAEAVEPMKRKKLRLFFMAAGAIVILAVLAAVMWRVFFLKPVPIPASKPSLAILDFENPGGDETLEAWLTSFPILLVTDMEQSRFVNVSYYPLEGQKSLSENLAEAAKKWQFNYAASGSLKKAGGNISVTVLVHNLKDEGMNRPIQAICRDESDLMAKADELTREIKRSINLSARQVSNDIDKNAIDITTHDPKAFKLYSQGMRLRPKEILESTSTLRKAVEIDPEFALAYASLYVQSNYGGREHTRKKYLEKAFEKSGRLPDKQRLRTRADYYRECRGNWDKAAKAFKEILILYPGDRTVSLYLSGQYMNLEEWDKAIPILEKLIQENKRRNSAPDENLAQCYAGQGLYDKAEKVLDNYINAFPDRKQLVGRSRLYCYEKRKDFKAAHDFIEQIFPPKSDNLSYALLKGGIFQEQGDLASAENEFKKAIEQDNPTAQINGFDRLGTLYLHKGKIELARLQYQRGLELSRDKKFADWQGAFHAMLAHLSYLSGHLEDAGRNIEEACQWQLKCLEELGRYEFYLYQYPLYLQLLHERALITLESGDMELFEKQAAELKQAIEKDPRKRVIRRYYHLLGHRELKHDDFSKAIHYFEKALSLHSSENLQSEQDLPRYFYSLAEAYRLGGQLEKASETYQKIGQLLKGEYGEFYARSLYWLGKIDEQMGNKIQAAENYKKFLSVWGDADPIFSEVEDARNRLAGLGSD